MISIIISSKTPYLFNEVSRNIQTTIGVEFEIIMISNPNGEIGICQAYNEGAVKAKYDYLVFCHEDISFHTRDWGQKVAKHLSGTKNSLIGVLGCLIKTKTPSGVYSAVQKINRINQLQRTKDNKLIHYYSNPLNEHVSKVVVLDGMFLATTISNWQKYPFDAERLKGFHGYDIDFSLNQRKNGNVIVIYDILIEHFSSGGNTIDWVNAQIEIIQKWKRVLPLSLEKKKSKSLISAADQENRKELALALFKNKYKLKLAYKTAIQYILRQPNSRINLYFIKQMFLSIK